MPAQSLILGAQCRDFIAVGGAPAGELSFEVRDLIARLYKFGQGCGIIPARDGAAGVHVKSESSHFFSDDARPTRVGAIWFAGPGGLG